MKAGRIVLLVFGILFIIVSFGLLVGGGVVLAADSAFKDNQGYYTTGKVPISVSSAAIVSQPADIHVDSVWFDRNPNLAAVRIEATNTNASKPIFIGIARESDLSNYLSGVSHDEITGFSDRATHTNYFHFPGANAAPPPTSQTFWLASATGTGTQTLQWNVTSGNYAFILMNADGSSPVNGDVSLEVKIPEIVHGIGLGLLIAGIVLLIGGGVMIFFAVHGW